MGPTALILTAALGLAAPGANAFPNGSFEKLGPDGLPLGAPIKGRQNVRLVAEEGNHFIRLTNDDPAKVTNFVMKMPVPADWVAVRVACRLRAEDLETGKEAWHDGRLALRFERKDGTMVGGYGPVPELKADSPWRTLTVRQQVPAGAEQISFTPGLYFCTGTLDLDDIRVAGEKAPPPADANKPADGLTWGDEPIERDSPARATICLNGWWRFQPAPGAAESPAEVGWGYLRVPGSWSSNGWPPVRQAELLPGAGRMWPGKLQSLARAWYQRPLTVPADWKGRAVLLDLRRVSTDARVVVNGIECGVVHWPGGAVDITRAVRPGMPNTLRLLVAAVKDAEKVTVYMGPGQVHQKAASLNSRGLTGDVLLRSRPAGAHVRDVFVRTSVARGRVALDVELAEVARAGEVRITATMLDEDGKLEKRFAADAEVAAAPAQTVTVAWPWKGARLWDVGQPSLYRLRLAVTGAGLDDEIVRRFGFREFRIEGRRFLLNGREIRLRPTLADRCFTIEQIDGALTDYRRAGYNIAELWPWDHDQRGVYHFRELLCSRADEAGFPLIGVAMSMKRYIYDTSWRFTWDDPGVKDRWAQRMRADLRRYRNHPSVLMWATSANFFGHALDQDPRRIGRRGWADDDEGWKRKADAGMEGIAEIKRADPTRPVMTHQGAYVGDVHTINHYLCLLPLQDREEWLTAWAADGEMPYMGVEFGTPLFTTMLRGRNGFGKTILSEPLMTEFCAAYLGGEAYRLEAANYRSRLAGAHRDAQQYANWHGKEELEHAPAFQRLLELFIANTWRSWRAIGCTGGMVPWSKGHGWRRGPDYYKELATGPFTPGRRGPYHPRQRLGHVHPLREGPHAIDRAGRALLTVNAPTLAYLCGPAGNITAKDHNFFPGQTVAKQVCVINDARSELAYKLTWTASLGGQEVAVGSSAGRIEPASTVFVPVEFPLPESLPAAKVEGAIALDATVGEMRQTHRFPFAAFRRPEPLDVRVAAHDPAGRTTKLLTALGCDVVGWDGKATDRLVAVGRDALSADGNLPGDLDAFVRDGGRAIVFVQRPDVLRQRLGLRVSAVLTRRAFPVRADHPALGGLGVEDLRDFAGASTLLEPYPRYEDGDFREGHHGVPYWGWRWGARGAVSSAAVEKPHRAGWRPILESGFDLAYTPLMELDHGRGRLIWCMLDLADHADEDAAARRLAASIVTYAASAPTPGRTGKTVYLGGRRGAGMLDAAGLTYARAAKLDEDATLAVIGPEATPAGLEAWLRAGGRALLLARASEQAPLGATLKRREAFAGSLDVPAWRACRGLSASDLRWRADHDAWLLAGGCEIGAGGLLGRRRVGKGLAVFSQIDPDRFDTEEKTYFRLTRWRQTRALAQVLANLGGAFDADTRVFRGAPREVTSVSLAGPWRAKLLSQLPESPSAAAAPADPGISDAAGKLVGPNVDDADWEKVAIPGLWDRLRKCEGEAIFRTTVTVPPNLAGKDLVLRIGPVDDFDETFFNGTPVGRTDKSTPNYWAHKRRYVVPARLVRPGPNVIAVRVFDRFGGGGIGGNAEETELRLKDAGPNRSLYHADYRDDFELGDDPYRYYRW